MAETLEFYREQMRQMRVQRDAHAGIVAGLEAELAELKAKRLAHIESKKKPVVKRTRK